MPREPLPRYLHPNYDPMKDKMDRLREILIHNKVKTPSGNVRKQDFVDLFEEHIRPQVPALREYYNNIVPSEEGIIKVPASAMTSLLNTKPSAKIPTRQRSTTAGLSSQKELKSLSSSTPTIASSSSAPLLKQAVPQDEPSGATDKAEKIKSKPRSTSENEESRTSIDSTRGRKSRASSIRSDSDIDGVTSRVRHRKKHSEKKKKMRSDNFSDENPFQSNSESERRRRSKSREHSSTSRASSKSRSSRSRRKSYDEGNGRAKDHDNVFILPSQPPFSSYMHTPKYSLSSFNRADLDTGPFHSSPLLAKSRRISAATLAQPKPVYFGHSAQFQGAAGGFRRYNEIQQRNSGPLRFGNFLPLTPECVLNRAKEYQSLQVADVIEQILHQRAGIEESIAVISISGLLIRRHVLRRREEERVIHSLVDNVLSKLADQSHYHYIDPVLCLDPYLPQIHLRDALLTNAQTPAKRQELWDKVSAIVDRNANVRVSAQEVRGEIHRVWEWVGASGVLSMKAMSNRSSLYSGDSMHPTSSHIGEKPTMAPPQSESHDNLFGSTGDSDLEFVNPARSLYPSLLKEVRE
ncbi:inner nuclear membrane protein enriched at telomere/subtelomere region [Mortierella sp. AD010]|nr:inner nuclear membrane protein enriched at telomere/subtelomere region [Mortierella sp. AD010]